MRKRLLVVVCLLVLLVHARTTEGFQQTKLTDKLHSWIEQATPVELSATQSDYDPEKIVAAKIETLDLTIQDKRRERQIPLRVYLPKQSDSKKRAEVVLYSPCHYPHLYPNSSVYCNLCTSGKGLKYLPSPPNCNPAGCAVVLSSEEPAEHCDLSIELSNGFNRFFLGYLSGCEEYFNPKQWDKFFCFTFRIGKSNGF